MEAHDFLAERASKKLIGVALTEFADLVQKNAAKEKPLSVDSILQWQHVVRCREALDDVKHIFQDLQDEGTPPPFRDICIQNLQQWIAWDRQNDFVMMNALETWYPNPKKENVRIKMMELFHYFPESEAAKAETYQSLVDGLDNDLLPIRALSHWHLRVLPKTAEGARIAYDPAWPREIRVQAQAVWNKYLSTGKLPTAPGK
jgi:hypothetical protein